MSIDKIAVSTEPRVEHAIYVDPGEHRLEAFFAGSRSATKTFTGLEGGQQKVSLEPAAKAPPAEATAGAGTSLAPSSSNEHRSESSAGLPAVAITGMAVTAVLGGIALWSGLDTLKAHDEATQAKPKYSPDQYSDGVDCEHRTNWLIGATAAVGVATLGVFCLPPAGVRAGARAKQRPSYPPSASWRTPKGVASFGRGRSSDIRSLRLGAPCCRSPSAHPTRPLRGSHQLAPGPVATSYLSRKAQDNTPGAGLYLLSVLHDDLGMYGWLVERLLDEVTQSARIAHPNVEVIADFGTTDNHSFVATRFVEGATLAQIMSRQLEMPVRVVLPIVVDVLRGLHAAHSLRDDAVLLPPSFTLGWRPLRFSRSRRRRAGDRVRSGTRADAHHANHARRTKRPFCPSVARANRPSGRNRSPRRHLLGGDRALVDVGGTLAVSCGRRGRHHAAGAAYGDPPSEDRARRRARLAR